MLGLVTCYFCRYRLDFTEAAELAESPGGMRLTGLSILPCFTSASEREDHSDTAPAQMFQSYLGSVLVTETSYAKSPLTSLRSCDAVLAVDWCSADSPVQLSTFLSWQTAGALQPPFTCRAVLGMVHWGFNLEMPCGIDAMHMWDRCGCAGPATALSVFSFGGY